jgi:hypothetical protein
MGSLQREVKYLRAELQASDGPLKGRIAELESERNYWRRCHETLVDSVNDGAGFFRRVAMAVKFIITGRIDLDLSDDDNLLHPSIHPYQAVTGRESCSNPPNLYNVQKETTLRSPYPIPARSAFRPKPGYVNFHIDYAGIEPTVNYEAKKEEVEDGR